MNAMLIHGLMADLETLFFLFLSALLRGLSCIPESAVSSYAHRLILGLILFAHI